LARAGKFFDLLAGQRAAQIGHGPAAAKHHRLVLVHVVHQEHPAGEAGERGIQQLAVEGGAAVRQGDVLQLGYVPAGAKHGAIFSLDGGGSILNISSVGGVSPDKGLGVYCISKAAINMLTRAMALELGEHNITVNALALGVVQTRFSQALWSNEKLIAEEMSHTPLARISQPEEVARMALAMVSEASSYMTGQIIVMDGGGSI